MLKGRRKVKTEVPETGKQSIHEGDTRHLQEPLVLVCSSSGDLRERSTPSTKKNSVCVNSYTKKTLATSQKNELNVHESLTCNFPEV